MEVDQSINLLDLPSEILEKIVNYLPFLTVRKNLRLTCRRLYNFCNSEYFCRNEKIVWPNSDQCQGQIIADFNHSSRGCYNLFFKSTSLGSYPIAEFFEQHGAEVRFLHFENIEWFPNLLELITFYCEKIVSLNFCSKSFAFFCSSEPNYAPRPSVTSLVLQVNVDSSAKAQMQPVFHQIPSIFPCVKHLKITLRDAHDRRLVDTLCGILKGILNLASNFRHLQSLDLHMLIDELPAEVPQFPNLKNLRLYLIGGTSHGLHGRGLRSSWQDFINRFIGVNISSIEISEVNELYMSDMIPSLTGVRLEHLSLRSDETIRFNIDDFEALVSSHLKMMCFDCTPIAPWAEHMTENWALEANKTVTDLEVGFSYHYDQPDHKMSLMVLFATHFHGLVHLETNVVNDTILQRIFKYQKNLRSLILRGSEECSIEGFCGGENTIADLQKLELLQIEVDTEVLQSERFQTAFRFPRLLYLNLWAWSSNIEVCSLGIEGTNLEIPANFLKSCTNLAAVNFRGFKNPSSTLSLSLFQNLKYLNYVNVRYGCGIDFRFTYVNLNHFYWTDWAKLLSECDPESFYYNQVLDRTVFISNTGYDVQIHAPKIGSYTIDWISVCKECR